MKRVIGRVVRERRVIVARGIMVCQGRWEDEWKRARVEAPLSRNSAAVITVESGKLENEEKNT
jgi:hypothetical protein